MDIGLATTIVTNLKNIIMAVGEWAKCCGAVGYLDCRQRGRELMTYDLELD